MDFRIDDDIPFSMVPDEASFEELLEQRAYFKLKPALRLLTSLVSSKYQEILGERKKFEARDSDMKIGIFKVGSTWWFYPPAFKSEFYKNIKFQAKKPPKHWGRKTFFEKAHGIYYMSDVCNQFYSIPHPLNVHSLRLLIIKNEEKNIDTRKTMGAFRVWTSGKQTKSNYFLEMPRFGEWVKTM